ncbi:MAG TPA: tRNA (adenosine(37)-N6)-threonylcarbamoyltransferase complex transferase subunit TsaD [Polyangiaceae bacterium]|nr:tRNA (adenosine(37)-N6)-threonylcarbamoyltransferase complex transferase subunit TsaD [Polyangiaceae bacterium]
MLVLGIETSCDETAAAVVDGRRVLADVIHSQVVHAEFGGVVPELASRDHMTHAVPVVNEALRRAGVQLEDLGAIAVTCRPGLSGALLVGTQVARALAWARDLPLVGVDHLVGHLLAVHLSFPDATPTTPAGATLGGEEPPLFPYIGLLVSGGHTALYRVDGPLPSQMRELGGTRDDAAGEAYDKVAKLLGLGYPGGPWIDRLAAEGDPTAVDLAAPMPQRDSLEFSFSGLKTNVMRWVHEHGRPTNDDHLRNLCAAFQRRVTDSLIAKSIAAARQEGLDTIVLGGGVAANRELRARGREACERAGLRLVVPSFAACTDNAAMIAYAGARLIEAGEDHRHALTISPKSILPRVTLKGGGPREPAPARRPRSERRAKPGREPGPSN